MTSSPPAALRASSARVRDPLTGLAGEAEARDTLARWQAAGRPNIHAMLVAFGEFGALNTAFGRDTGDAVLVEAARRIVHFTQDEFAGRRALVARVSGSGFLVAIHGDVTRDRWQWQAEALADTLALPHGAAGEQAVIRLWPRIVLARTGSGEEPAGLLDKLAEGLNLFRKAGASRTAWIGGKAALIGAGRRKLQTDLLRAIDRDEISVVFQPQYSCRDRHLIGAEALARWHHPQAGELGAATLFAVADRIDFVAQLSRHVIGLALQHASRWPGDLQLSVNATAGDLAADSFGKELLRLASDAGFPPSRLTVEITEQSLLGDIVKAGAMLEQLTSRGVRLALDDFGAGFCNFRYLKLLPLHVLKLDRAMVDGIVDNPPDLAILRGIIAMAKALDLEVVAEGIENEAQRALVAEEGCAYFQGFLESAPLGAAAFTSLAADTL